MRPPRPDQARRRRLRPSTVIGLLVVALVVVGGAAAFRLSTAADALRRAETQIEVAASSLREGRLDAAIKALSVAESEIESANAGLQTAPELALIGVLPVVDQNLTTLQEAIQLAATVVHGGQRILVSSRSLESADGTLQVSLSDGSIPSDAVVEALTEIEALSEQLPERPAPPPSPLLLPATRELWTEVHEESLARHAELDRLQRGLTLLAELAGIDRPRRYLIAVANTAEMRGTGGMMLNYGVLEGTDGVVDLTAFGRVEELDVPVPVDPDDVGLDEDFLRRWEGFDITREWRNATLSGDFTVAAPVLQAMYRRSTGLPVDGVIQVDATGLSAVLRAVGPVTVPEIGTVTAENVEALVLNEAYRRFPGVEERTDVLGDVAEAAFRRLVDGDFDSVRDLAESIAVAVDGRHIAMFSSTTAVQNAVVSFGADGAIADPEELDHVHLTVQNVGGNKLDYYLDTAISIVGDRPPGDIGRWTVDVTLANEAPIGESEPRYVFGPYGETVSAGTYSGVVTLYLPQGSDLDGFSDEAYRLPPSLQTENGRPVVGFWVDVPAGESRTVSLDLTLPPRPRDEAHELELVPSARVRPTTATVRIDLGDVVLSESVVLDRRWILSENSEPFQPSPEGPR